MTIQIFEFEDQQLRTSLIDGETWWVATDVCACLGISNSRDAISNLPDDEKQQIDLRNSVGYPDTIQRGNPYAVCISEPGLYRLVFKSRKPEAERFKRWVFNEVLPQIRRTGRYAPQGTAGAIPSTGKTDLESRYLALLDEHMELLKWKADFFEKQAQPKPKRTARRALTEEEQSAIKQLISEGKSDSEIALQTGRANSTVWQIRRLVDAQSNGEAGNA
jgi:prophage antirepressor-like protein